MYDDIRKVYERKQSVKIIYGIKKIITEKDGNFCKNGYYKNSKIILLVTALWVCFNFMVPNLGRNS